jgi:hypothetical protein
MSAQGGSCSNELRCNTFEQEEYHSGGPDEASRLVDE